MTIYQQFENLTFDYIEIIFEREQRNKEIKEKIEIINQKYMDQLKTMSDDDVLDAAVERWVALNSYRKIFRDLIDDGDKKEAFRVFNKMVSESGSGGGM